MKSTKPKTRTGRNRTDIHVRLVEPFATPLMRLAGRNRRSVTQELCVAVAVHLRANGIRWRDAALRPIGR